MDSQQILTFKDFFKERLGLFFVYFQKFSDFFSDQFIWIFISVFAICLVSFETKRGGKGEGRKRGYRQGHRSVSAPWDHLLGMNEQFL